MSENKFTPLPWRITTDEGGLWVDSDYSPVAMIVSDMQYADDRDFADANLIAAAPELLDALENMVDVYYGNGGTRADSVLMAEKAIKKAKGIE